MAEDDGNETVVVDVDTSGEAETPPVDDAPEVIVVDTGSDEGSSNDLAIGEQLGALTVSVGTLAATVEALTGRLDVIEARQTFTEERADEALDAAIDATITAEDAADEAEEIVEEFIEPQREHWMWRKPLSFRRARGEGEVA